MSAMSDVYVKARSEIIALFGWNVDKLSPDQTLRLDCAVALRLALDDLQGRVVRGESIDVAKMLTAADALSRLLPPAALAAPPEEANTPDPRTIMWETYLGMRRRGELFDLASTFEGRGRRIAELEAEVAALKAAAAAPREDSKMSCDLPADAGARVGNVVKLRDNPVRRAAPAAPPKPEPPQYELVPANEPWRPYSHLFE
jgi:hypothetical protein